VSKSGVNLGDSTLTGGEHLRSMPNSGGPLCYFSF
jgi:hypothetical protein